MLGNNSGMLWKHLVLNIQAYSVCAFSNYHNAPLSVVNRSFMQFNDGLNDGWLGLEN